MLKSNIRKRCCQYYDLCSARIINSKMPIPDYNKIKNINREPISVVAFDFNNLSPLEIFELYNLILVSSSDYDIDELSKKMEGFFSRFNDVNFHSHEEKTTFYTLAEKIYLTCNQVGLSTDTSSLITASFLEVIDNAFSHNLGKWPTNHYKRAMSLIHNDTENKTLLISVADIGVGFFRTLKNKYPQINSEAEAIELAIQANTSSRPQDYQGHNTGGNGLFYLQKNIFNGIPGKLYIRSRGTLTEVLDQKQTKLISSELPYNYGVNLFFTLNYE